MKTATRYKIGLALMIIINGVLLFLMVQGPPRPRHQGQGLTAEKGNLMHIISQRLELSPQQVEEYDMLAKAHQIKMTSAERDQKKLIKSYFSFLKETSSPPEAKEQLLEQLKNLEAEKIQLTYRHFDELKSLCTPEQKDRFELITEEILKILINEEKKLPPPPRDF